MNLKNKLFILLSLVAFSFATIAAAEMMSTKWTIDKTHSSINFEVRHFFSKVLGSFEDYDAEVYFSPNNLEESSVSFTIPVESINTKNDKRDNHLKSEDFFNAPKYPNITFNSTSIELVGNNEFVAKGTLTIKDVSKEVELPFTLLGVQDNPFQEGTKVAGIRSEFQLLRNDYHVGTGDWVSDAVVGNEVDVILNLELNSVSDDHSGSE